MMSEKNLIVFEFSAIVLVYILTKYHIIHCKYFQLLFNLIFSLIYMLVFNITIWG